MRSVLFATLVGLSATTALGADAPSPKTLSPEEAREGFAPIFNGTTLDGWTGDVGGYGAEDGLLVCNKGGGNVFTCKEFGDLVFRFDFRFEPGGNNGVSVRGHEIQILDDYAPKHANLKPCQYHGSIYCCVPAERGHTKPAGEWNSEEIFCQGSHWKVTVNGAVVVDVDLATVPETQDLAKRTRGPLGFRGHGCRVEFRDLRVKELPSAPEKAAASAQ